MKKKFNFPSEIDKYLLANGIKPSYHRVMTLRYLWNNSMHPTVDSIYSYLSKKIPTLSKTTIYNTVSLFVKKGILSAISVNGNELRNDFNTDMNIHLRCIKCEDIYDIKIKNDIMFLNNKKIDGHQILECQIYLKGICKKCSSKV